MHRRLENIEVVSSREISPPVLGSITLFWVVSLFWASKDISAKQSQFIQDFESQRLTFGLNHCNRRWKMESECGLCEDMSKSILYRKHAKMIVIDRFQSPLLVCHQPAVVMRKSLTQVDLPNP